MILSVEGKGKALVQVSYIAEGNPAIEVSNHFTISCNMYNEYFQINNRGDGLLMWGVALCPRWLIPYNEDGLDARQYGSIISQYSSGYIRFSLNQEFLPDNLTGNLSGNIIIASNDKQNPFVTVEIDIFIGNPSLYFYNNSETVNFGRTETEKYLSFSNQGDGLLVWNIEGCPNWLTISETNGTLSPYNSTSLTFTCNRDLLPDGNNTAIIYLKTNDKNHLSTPITVTANGNT
jgi:hypothetical protein